MSESQRKSPTASTIAHQQQVLGELPFHDRTSYERAARGRIATLDPLRIRHDRDGRTVYDLTVTQQFLSSYAPEHAPHTVNPSLWRQAQLNALYNGLFEVVDGIYQVRSFDIANITFIRGARGWIVIDPLTSSEVARAALDLVNQHIERREVTAVVYTHSHIDHFAGVLGVTNMDAVARGEVSITAPEHFTQEALSENVLAGNVMGRRATYMYGNLLPHDPTGFVTTGLGAALSMGSTGFIPPTDTIRKTGETRTIDGVVFDFQMTPGTEAPAEFVFFLPEFGALCMAEITSHHLHNVYTLRGAQVRDALAWSEQIDESISRYGAALNVQFASHHWPIWGREDALAYLERQRDLYRYIHDQTLRLANHGYTKEEIAERITLPTSLAQDFSCRGYYGSVHHNVRAVYVKYLGFFDGNPATLYPHPPSAAGARYVDLLGGADQVVHLAQQFFNSGDYRFAAELLNHVVLSIPEHDGARCLLADTLEQLGYQAESAPWRNFYLTGAQELRQPNTRVTPYAPSDGMLAGMPLEDAFSVASVRFNPARCAALDLRIGLEIADAQGNVQKAELQLQNGVLRGRRVSTSMSAICNAYVTCPLHALKAVLTGRTDGAAFLADDHVAADGDVAMLASVLGSLDTFNRRFPIVTPRPA